MEAPPLTHIPGRLAWEREERLACGPYATVDSVDGFCMTLQSTPRDSPTSHISSNRRKPQHRPLLPRSKVWRYEKNLYLVVTAFRGVDGYLTMPVEASSNSESGRLSNVLTLRESAQSLTMAFLISSVESSRSHPLNCGFSYTTMSD